MRTTHTHTHIFTRCSGTFGSCVVCCAQLHFQPLLLLSLRVWGDNNEKHSFGSPLERSEITMPRKDVTALGTHAFSDLSSEEKEKSLEDAFQRCHDTLQALWRPHQSYRDLPTAEMCAVHLVGHDRVGRGTYFSNSSPPHLGFKALG